MEWSRDAGVFAPLALHVVRCINNPQPSLHARLHSIAAVAGFMILHFIVWGLLRRRALVCDAGMRLIASDHTNERRLAMTRVPWGLLLFI